MNKFITLLLVVIALSASISTTRAEQQDECSFCTFVATYVENLLLTNATITQVEAELEKVCVFVPEAFQSTCTTLIDQYFEALVNKENPSTVCSQLGYCTASSDAQEEKPVQGAVGCSICTFIVAAGEKYVESNATVSEITQFLENECSILGSQFQEICKALINEYADEIIEGLINKESPNTICTSIGLCGSAQVKLIRFEKLKSEVSSDFGCPVCKWIVGEIENYVEQNQTEGAIIQSLEGDCSILVEKSWIQICQSIVAQYAPELIQDVINSENPTTACTQIGFCGNSTSSSSSSSSNPTTGSSSNPTGSATGGSGASGSGSGSALSGSGSGSGSSAAYFVNSNGFAPKSKKIRVNF